MEIISSSLHRFFVFLIVKSGEIFNFFSSQKSYPELQHVWRKIDKSSFLQAKSFARKSALMSVEALRFLRSSFDCLSLKSSLFFCSREKRGRSLGRSGGYLLKPPNKSPADLRLPRTPENLARAQQLAQVLP